MGVASGCGEQEAGVASGSGWNLWCGCKEVYKFPHTTYLIPTPLVSVLLCSSIPTCCSVFNIFFVLVPVPFYT